MLAGASEVVFGHDVIKGRGLGRADPCDRKTKGIRPRNGILVGPPSGRPPLLPPTYINK